MICWMVGDLVRLTGSGTSPRSISPLRRRYSRSALSGSRSEMNSW
jgi:hypothetical protein